VCGWGCDACFFWRAWLYFPNSVKLNKVWFDRKRGKVLYEKLGGAQKFAAVMRGFGSAVTFEMREAAVGGAIGVAHHEDALGLMEADRHADLLEDEVLLEVVARRSERFCPASDDDHVGALDALLLEKLADGTTDAGIEAAEHSGISDVGLGRRVEVEDFAHDDFTPVELFYRA